MLLLSSLAYACVYAYVASETSLINQIPSAIPQGYCLTRTCFPLTSVITLLPMTAKGILPCSRESARHIRLEVI